MNRIRYLFSFLLLMIAFNSAAHPVPSNPDTTGADMDLIIIESFFRNVENMTCSVNRKEGPLGGMLTVDSGWCKVGRNQYNITTVRVDTSRCELQNGVFSAYINHLDSNIVVRKPGRAYVAFMKIDLLDHMVRRAYIQRMYALDSAGYRVLQVEFKPEAPYTRYRMVYHPQQLIPLSVSMIKKTGTGPWQIEISYNSVSFDPFPDNVFSTDPYFSKQYGKFELIPPYQQYQLLDHTWLP